MTDNKSNTKKPTPSKVYNLASAMLAFQKLAVTAKKDGKAIKKGDTLLKAMIGTNGYLVRSQAGMLDSI